MTNFSRRQFLKQIGACGAVFLGAPLFGITFGQSETSAPFEFLVVGDSLVWGQGLEEKDKFYMLTRNWLETEIFAGRRSVNLMVKAHSGATLTFHKNEAEAFRRAGKDETKGFPPEVNVSFPSITTQIELARQEYRNQQKSPEAVNLIMLSGSITDIEIASILNPFGKNESLRRDISMYCDEAMHEFLENTARAFPNALIALIGYYPMISPQTPAHELFNFLLEANNFPRPLKPLANNLLTKQLFKIIRQKVIRRSRLWAGLSDLKLQEAVRRANSKFDKPRVIFIKAPITEETCFATKNTLLFRLEKKGRTPDALYESRMKDCRPFLTELKTSAGLKYPIKICEIAAVGHPNVEGAKAFAEAIKDKLKPVFQMPD